MGWEQAPKSCAHFGQSSHERFVVLHPASSVHQYHVIALLTSWEGRGGEGRGEERKGEGRGGEKRREEGGGEKRREEGGGEGRGGDQLRVS